MKKKLALIAIGLATIVGAVRPVAAADYSHLEWFMLTATGQIHGRLRGYVELQPRFGEDPQDGNFDLRTVLARGALGWEVAKGWSLWAGYGFTPVFDPDRDESRIFQQSLYDWKMGPFNAQHRLRLEQRFLEHESDVSWRLRNQLRVVYPLPKWPSWSLVAADEVFFNLNSVTSGPRSGFDQNRLFLGVSHQLTPHLRVELDYLNNTVKRQPHKRDFQGNGTFVQLAYNW